LGNAAIAEQRSSFTLSLAARIREPWLDRDVRLRIHAYLAIICRDLGSELVRELLRKHGVEFDERYVWD